ncbi:MAG: bifunctional hydroxymethylpyrimidine kinase/phosphomethylpyrimidine kinase [Verrucomicrobiota bacterium]
MLTIAGSDSGGCAGVQADGRAIRDLGGHALTAITAITAQNSAGVAAWSPVAVELVVAQIRTALDGFPVVAAKTGLLPGTALIEAVVAALPRGLPLVVDPVMGSTSGTRFWSDADLDVVRAVLVPRATLLTPNLPEAAALSGLPVGTVDEIERAGRRLLELGAGAVLIKGGHGDGHESVDWLLTSAGEGVQFVNDRLPTANTRGTGCVLSAAAAFYLGRGEPVVAAVKRAGAFLQAALRRGAGETWRGAGPALR